jgi:hypothetical protein
MIDFFSNMSLAEEANISFPESNVGFAGSPKKTK